MSTPNDAVADVIGRPKAKRDRRTGCDIRSETLSIRMGPDEIEDVRAAADIRGQTCGQFLRDSGIAMARMQLASSPEAKLFDLALQILAGGDLGPEEIDV